MFKIILSLILLFNSTLAYANPQKIGSAARCEAMFDSSSNEMIDRLSNGLKLTIETIAPSSSESFWNIVSGLAENADSRISLSSSGFTLAKLYNKKFYTYTTYTYEPNLDYFVPTKIEYSGLDRVKKLISDQPFNFETKTLNSHVFENLNLEQFGVEKSNIKIIQQISYKEYEKVALDIKSLNLFTSFELKMMARENKMRNAKYISKAYLRQILDAFSLRAIKLGSFNIVKGAIQAGVIVGVASAFPVFKDIQKLPETIASMQVKHSIEVPGWVAPTITEMAAEYPQPVAAELIRLTTSVSDKNIIKNNSLPTTKKNNLRTLDINQTHSFTVVKNPKDLKTYFVLINKTNSEKFDFFAVPINPKDYPMLTTHFMRHAKVNEKVIN